MKKTLVVLATILALAACKKNSGGGGDTPSDEPQYAPELYWADDYSGPYGLQVGQSNRTKSPRIMLAGVQLYTTGVNNFDLFTQSFTKAKFDRDIIDKTVDVLKTERVPIVRFSCTPFYAQWMGYYFDNKEEYFSTLDYLATKCDEAHVLLIPSIYWNTSCMPTYYGEKLTAWGDTGSQTYKFMQTYTKEVVDCLKGHKSLAAWEFGNEFNLAADIGIGGYEQMGANCVQTALKGFAEVCLANDPHGRLTCSGNSVMRNAQYHLYYEKSWQTDSYSEYVQMTEMMTPAPMLGISEHVYDEAREFSDLGKQTLDNQLIYAERCAASIGKVYYVGEFTGPDSTGSSYEENVTRHYQAHYANRVQLSLVWNFDYDGGTEHSFKADTDRGDFTFGLMRKYNKKFAELLAD